MLLIGLCSWCIAVEAMASPTGAAVCGCVFKAPLFQLLAKEDEEDAIGIGIGISSLESATSSIFPSSRGAINAAVRSAAVVIPLFTSAT